MRLFMIVFLIEFLVILFVGILILIVIFLVFENFFISSPRIYNYGVMSTMIWFVLILMIIPYSIYVKNQIDNLGIKIKLDFRIVLFTVYFVSILTVSNYYKADRIKLGYPNKYVSFDYEEKSFKSDDCLVYVGMTENYLFLRELKEKRNIIFQRDKIGKIEIIKRKYKKQ